MNASQIFVNDRQLSEDEARLALSEADSGVVSVRLQGDRLNQVFEFSFSVARQADLDGVEDALNAFIATRTMSLQAIDHFLSATERFETAGDYRFGLANYFYGVLAREDSADSALTSGGRSVGYIDRYRDAIAKLDGVAQPGADAVCALIAFQDNHFVAAQRRGSGARVSRAAGRFVGLLSNHVAERGPIERGSSLDYSLSDDVTEQIIAWTCLPLDGSVGHEVDAMVGAIPAADPNDQVKLRILASEHLAAAGLIREAQSLASVLRHGWLTEQWAEKLLVRRARGRNT